MSIDFRVFLILFGFDFFIWVEVFRSVITFLVFS